MCLIASFCGCALAPGVSVQEELDVRQVDLGIRLRIILMLVLAVASLVQDRCHFGAVDMLAHCKWF